MDSVKSLNNIFNPDGTNNDGKFDETPKNVIHAVKGGNIVHVKHFLNHMDASLETKDKDGRTLLMIAVDFQYKDIVIELLNKGADLTASDNEGRTPLMWAVYRG